MKKIIITGILVIGGITVAACEEEPTAEIIVYNCLGFDDPSMCTGGTGSVVESFVLMGEEDTGNLLDAQLVPREVRTLDEKVLPGMYTWRVEFAAAGGLANNLECNEELELFPGVNNLRLQPCAGGLGGTGL